MTSGGYRLASAAILAASASVLSCGGQKATTESRCTSSCEAQLWPRLIVAIFDEEGAEVENTTIVAVDQNGNELTLYVHGCPTLSKRYMCTYGAFGFVEGSVVNLQVRLGSEEQAKQVALRPPNHCGREIAYVGVSVTSDRKLSFATPEYISPCLQFD